MNFTKMHGLGNDFMVVDATRKSFSLTPDKIAQLANRHTGIGFDQLLIIEPSTEAHFFCRIFNADGSEAEQCGNGLRCVARFIHEEQLLDKPTFTIATKAGIFPARIKDYQHVTIAMSAPIIKDNLETLMAANTTIKISVLSVGNPHAIVKVDSTDTAAVEILSAAVSNSALFSDGANVGFMEVVNQHHIRLRTIERGAGETHACGSNACAAVAAGIVNQWLVSPVEVEFKLGKLHIEWQGVGSPIVMTGPADRVFNGTLD